MSVLKKEIVYLLDHSKYKQTAKRLHALEKILQKESTEAVLLVNAANAFNFIKRKVFLQNTSISYPAIFMFVTNCYATPALLFTIGGTEIKFNEDTTLEGPISMAIYALGITPLMMMIELVTTKCNNIKMVTFAGDFTVAGKSKYFFNGGQHYLKYD